MAPANPESTPPPARSAHETAGPTRRGERDYGGGAVGGDKVGRSDHFQWRKATGKNACGSHSAVRRAWQGIRQFAAFPSQGCKSRFPLPSLPAIALATD